MTERDVKRGEMALHFACWFDQYYAAAFLIEKGANLYVTDSVKLLYAAFV
jgi:ankyrin repeat protein